MADDKVRGVADLVFLVDVTGSMAPVIDALKTNIGLFIDSLVQQDANNACPVRDWRARVVGYRDFDVDREPFAAHPFVRDVDALKGQLNRLRADGGGDEPESLLDALYKVATWGSMEPGAQTEDPQRWRARRTASRVVVVFTDATYKPTMVIPEAKGGTVDDVINTLQAERIILSLFAPDWEGHHTLAETDKAEYQKSGTLENAAGLATLTSDPGKFQNTLRQLAKSISKSADTPLL